jgi:hypothetical protein
MRHKFALSVKIAGYFLGSQILPIPCGEGWGREDIDWLRAIAVLPVVAFHFEIPGIWGGYVGVDIFSVISGYGNPSCRGHGQGKADRRSRELDQSGSGQAARRLSY